MSIRDKARQKSVHRRTDSGELDVFEAARYFSTDTVTTITIPQRIGVMRSTNPGRSNLDIPPPPTLVLNLQHNNNNNNKKDNKKEQKKKPNSPGGKLASFFNSLISQTVSKKKNNKLPKLPTPLEDEAPVPSDWRTRWHSSMTAVATTIKSDISSSGFRTPPPYMINTPMKPYKKPTNSTLDHEFRFVTHNRFMEDEDGYDDSDSSSDLFELQLNYNHKHVVHHKLGYCANDLPVYETTCMDKIKLSSTTPITNGPFRN